MNYTIIKETVCPLRLHANDRSEMVSQILYGQPIEILEERKKTSWIRVRNLSDAYEGWIDKKFIGQLDFDLSKVYLSESRLSIAVKEDDISKTILLAAGSLLADYDVDNQRFRACDSYYKFTSSVAKYDLKQDTQFILNYARLFVGSPYLWGGKNAFGIDCSGLSQIASSLAGYKIPRDAHEQALVGDSIAFPMEAKAGDLAFFSKLDEDYNDSNELIPSKIIHVGILTGDGNIIHAHGKVREDRFDHQGIFNIDTQEYTHRLRGIKRLI